MSANRINDLLSGAANRGAQPGDPWDQPLPLGWHIDAPPFPEGVFPPAVEEYVSALTEATQTPRDLPGTVALGILSASIGGRVDVQCPTWIEPTNLFAVPVLAPASRKSAVVSACREPLVDAERQLRETIGNDVHDSQTRWEVLSKSAEAAKAKAAKTGDLGDMDDALKSVRTAEEAREQIVGWPRLSTSDATPEALIGLLAEQGGRIAALSAEAGVFTALTGRYTQKPNLDPVLMAHAGDTITVDRRSRPPEHVDHPALTIVASIQPYALREMVSRDDFAGRGLLARVLWSLPADNTGHRRVRDVEPVPDAVAAKYRARITALATWAASKEDRTVVKLDDAATDLFLDYAEHVERLLRPTAALGEYRLTREWGGKLVGAVARIAGCLHAARGRDTLHEPIGAATVRDAIRLGEYYRAHAVLALTPADDQRTEAARTLLGWLVEKDMKAFKVRDLQRTGPGALRKGDVLGRLLDYLAHLGWVRPSAAGGYELHPDADELLNRRDTCDNCDTEEETPGQDTYTPPEDLSQPAATGCDNTPGLGQPVATCRSDLRQAGDTSKPPLTRENPGRVADVAMVDALDHQPRLVVDLAKLAGMDVWSAEKALKRLAADGHATYHPSGNGTPAAWSKVAATTPPLPKSLAGDLAGESPF
ncbi:MAG: YfjI family protein [Pseudonocardiaceae bacterium]